MAKDGTLYIGGQIGWTSDQKFVSDDFVAQTEQALQNILDVVKAAGGQAEDISRLSWYVLDKQEYLSRIPEVGKAYRKVLGRHFPAMSMLLIKELIEDRAVREIEAMAVLQQR